MASGQSPGSSLFWQPPLYPLFLVGLYGVSGVNIWTANVVQAFMGSITCALVFLLARRLFDRRTAIVAAALASV